MSRKYEGSDGGDADAGVKRRLGKSVARFFRLSPTGDHNRSGAQREIRSGYVIHNGDDWANPVIGPGLTLEQQVGILNSITDKQFEQAMDDLGKPLDAPDAVQQG